MNYVVRVDGASTLVFILHCDTRQQQKLNIYFHQLCCGEGRLGGSRV